jgi:hypothetical protein
VGRTEQVLGLAILLLLIGTIGGFVWHVSTAREPVVRVEEQAYGQTDADVPNPFPAIDEPGWRAPQRADRFNADDLYQKIDGRAEAYRQLGAVGLTFGTYSRADDPARVADVYWYDMEAPERALAMFRSERPPDAPAVALGQEGYQVGGVVAFCQGTAYVQVLSSRPDDVDAPVVLAIAARLARQIEGRE